MSLRKINHMDIVSDTCSIRCIIVIPEYLYRISLSYGYLHHIGEEVVRDSSWILSDESARMSTNRIEVSEIHYMPSGMSSIILQEILDYELGCTIGVIRLESAPFGKWKRILVGIDSS